MSGGFAFAPAAKDGGVSRQSDVDAQPPLADDMRTLQPGAEYWLAHTPDLGKMKADQLLDEMKQIEQWKARQLASTPEVLRMDAVKAQMQAGADALGRKAFAKAKPARKTQGKGKHADASAAPAAPLPRLLRERQSLQTSDPKVLAAEYDEIVDALQRDDLNQADRTTLQTELSNLGPAMGDELEHRAAKRQAETVTGALTHANQSGGTVDTVDIAKRIDSVRPLSGHPGQNYLMDGDEMVMIPDAQLKAIRASVIRGLGQQSEDILGRNEEVKHDLNEFVTRTYDDHPIVGFLSMLGSGENPLYWDEKIMPLIAGSNNARGRFDALAKLAKDPWGGNDVSLESMAMAISKADIIANGARSAFDSRQDKMFEATAAQVKVLQAAKFTGQIAANFAFTPAGAALYSAVEDSAVQGMEIHYSQRENFDYTGVLIDAGTSYFGGKVGAGVMGMAGKEASALRKAGFFILGDRVGAATTTASSMLANNAATSLHLGDAADRKHFSGSDILGATGHQLTDVMGVGEDALIGKMGHMAKGGGGGPRIPRGSGLGRGAAPEARAGTPEPLAQPDVAARPEAAATGPSATAGEPARPPSLMPEVRPQVPPVEVSPVAADPAPSQAAPSDPAAAQAPASLDPALAEWGKDPERGDRSTTKAQWKAKRQIERQVDRAFRQFDADEPVNDSGSPRVTGKADPRIDDRAVPGPRELPGGEQPKTKADGTIEDPRERILDTQHIPRREVALPEGGTRPETGAEAVARVNTVIGHKMSEFPALEALWNDARQMVLQGETLTADNKGNLYEKTRDAFWRRVRGNTPEGAQARALLAEAGFELPAGRKRAARLTVEGDVFKQDLTVSLDHIEEKGHGQGWQKALNADNLSLEFAGPNTEREIKQMRHPSLRPTP